MSHDRDLASSGDLLTRAVVAGAAALRRRPRAIASAALIIASLTVAWVMISGHRYSVTFQFTPQAQQGSGLQALASQVGIDVNQAAPGESPGFYAALITNPTILGQVARAHYIRSEGGAAGPLDSVLKVKEHGARARLANTVELLQELVTASADRRTGVVGVTVTTDDPVLSKGLADSVLVALQGFDKGVRETQGRNERSFLEQRLDAVRQELQSKEDALRDFVTRNRSYQGDPTLLLDFNRLQREVTQMEAVTESIRQSYEQARVDEVRDTPVITVVQQPALPAFPDRRHLVLKMLLGLLLGGITGLVAVHFDAEIAAGGRWAIDRFRRSDLRRTVPGDQRGRVA